MGTPFNFLEYPTGIALLVIEWRARYKLSLRDLVEMFVTHGSTFTHEAVRIREARFAPLLAARRRANRRGEVGCRGMQMRRRKEDEDSLVFVYSLGSSYL